MKKKIMTIIYMASFAIACKHVHDVMTSRWKHALIRMRRGYTCFRSDLVSSIIQMAKILAAREKTPDPEQIVTVYSVFSTTPQTDQSQGRGKESPERDAKHRVRYSRKS